MRALPLLPLAVGAFQAGLPPATHRAPAHRAPCVTAVDATAFSPDVLATMDPTALAGGAAVLVGGAALALKKGDEDTAAHQSTTISESPSSPPAPSIRKPAKWPAVGGKTGPHRMAGTMPPPPQRELWTPPPGWKPPSPPVVSWYDMGKRLTPPPPPPAPPAPPAPKPSPPPNPFEEMVKGFSEFFEQMTGSPKKETTTEWPAVGGKTGPHRMAGTMPPPPARELWSP